MINVDFLVTRAGLLEEALQYLDESRARRLKLLKVVQGKSLEKLLAVASQLDEDLSLVVSRPQPEQKTPFNESIDELHRAVMLELHPLR
jgi:hypothetical protein